MKSINIIYSNNNELQSFIKKQNFSNKNILVQIFTSVLDKNIIQNILDLLKQKINNVKIIGCSTSGEIINGKITQNQIVLNFNIFDNTSIKTTIIEKKSSDYTLGENIAKNISSNKTKLLITFANALEINGEEYLKGIKSVSKTIIAGGLAGDNNNLQNILLFNEEKIISNGAVAVSLDSDVLKVNTTYAFNWEGIGKIMKVTKAKDNVIYEIDGQKPIDVYNHYFGKDIAKNIIKVGVEFPVIFKKNNTSVARVAKIKKEDGSIVFTGNINSGEEIQFGYGNIESILQKDQTLYQSLENFDIESIFIFSCVARKNFLGKMIELEISPFGEITDVSGFFTYGEFFSTPNNSMFFNQTMTILVLSEQESKKPIPYANINIENSHLITLKALTHLIKATTKELIESKTHLENKIKEKTAKLNEKNIKLEYLYYHDTLTNLPNKFLLDKNLKEKKFYEALLIDIKQFSSINDIYGEIIGDEILKEFAKKLMQIAQKYNCSLYRVGADQFITINFNDTGICHYIKNDIVEMLKDTPIVINIDNNTLNIHLSVRCALVSKYYDNIKLKADLALNYAKKKNLDFIEYHEYLDLEKTLEKEIKTISLVKAAINDDRVIPVFQKIEKETEITYECLVRIKLDNKLISPFIFLDAISHTNYYFDITKIMIDKSFSIFENRKENISLNFSFRDIENEEIIEYLIEKIDEYNMYSRVIIEILENENIQNFEKLQKFITKVREYGVKIAIDDFGSGYSNFIYLAEIKPDYIKIDGTLIKDIDTDTNSFIITKHIHSFAKELGCKTIAEFIHNENVYNKVKELHIDGLQGYFIEQPKENLKDN